MFPPLASDMFSYAFLDVAESLWPVLAIVAGVALATIIFRKIFVTVAFSDSSDSSDDEVGSDS